LEEDREVEYLTLIILLSHLKSLACRPNNRVDGIIEESNMSLSWKTTTWVLGASGVVLLSAVLVAVGIAARPGADKSLLEGQARADERKREGRPHLVKAAHPVKDASVRISVRQLLSVEPFFEANLRTQVAGVVQKVPHSIGAVVKRGELLVEIAVPDLDEEVLQKQAVIRQRRKDVETTRAQIPIAEAQVAMSKEMVDQRRAEANQAVETREYRKGRYDRFVVAAEGNALQKSIVEEERRDYRSAFYAVLGAEAAVRKAQADVKEKESTLLAARADVELKEALVEVAQKDRDRARVFAGYARLTAPFDAVVTDRTVDEGDFVQNASTAQTKSMISVARTNIVTVVMKVPDNAAPFVTRDTEAILRFDELPGVKMRGRVTRFSPSISNKDRTMRVEVDLWNDTPENYKKFTAKCLDTWLSPLAATAPLNLGPLLAVSDEIWSKESKDRADPFPVLPAVMERSDVPLKLIPGMSGFMRLSLRQFHGAYLLPSCAVFNQGGKPYILEVRNGYSHLVPVRVQISDGKLAKVDIIVREADPQHDQVEVRRPLTGKETVILSGQVEIGDGQPVEVSFEK
jgi:multidrug resistance efflux pump